MTDNRTTERVSHSPRVREAIDELMREKDATDNRTTELREKLTERGIEYETNDHMGVCETSWNGFTAMQLTPGAKLMMAFTPEQAIAATLGEKPRDKTEEWLLNTCNQAAQDYVAQLEHERDELKQFVRDLIPFVCADDGIEGVEARMKALGIEVVDE